MGIRSLGFASLRLHVKCLRYKYRRSMGEEIEDLIKRCTQG